MGAVCSIEESSGSQNPITKYYKRRGKFHRPKDIFSSILEMKAVSNKAGGINTVDSRALGRALGIFLSTSPFNP